MPQCLSQGRKFTLFSLVSPILGWHYDCLLKHVQTTAASGPVVVAVVSQKTQGREQNASLWYFLSP